MDDYDYRGYSISETPDGTYIIDDFEFPTFCEAIEWVDDMVKESTEPQKPKLHNYLFFYIDNATDQSFEAKVLAYNLEEAKKLLRQNYDVYSIVDYDILD